MQKRGKILVFVLVLLLIIGLFSLYYYNKQKIKSEESYNSKGWKLYKQGKYDEAIAEFKKNLIRNPNNFFAHSGLGWSFYRKNIYDDAIDSFKSAININPNDYDVYNGLGWSYYKLTQYKNSINAFEKAIQLNPRHADSYNGLGWSYYNLNWTDQYWKESYKEWVSHFNQGKEMFEMAINLNPKNPSNYMGLGFLYQLKGRGTDSLADYELSKNFLEKTILLNSTFSSYAYSSLGWTHFYISRGKPFTRWNTSLLIDLFEKSISIEPHHYNYEGLGIVYLSLGDFNKSIEYFEKSSQFVNLASHSHTLSLMGFAYYFLKTDYNIGTYDEAIELFTKSLEYDPIDIYALDGLGWVYNRQGKYKEAIEKFNQVLTYDSNYADSHSGLGFANWKLGNLRLAAEQTQKAISLNPYTSIPHEHLGFIYMDMGDLEPAEKEFNLSIALGDADFHIYQGFGYLNFLKGKYGEAVNYYIQSIAKNPRNTNAYLILGKSYMYLEDYENAKKAFEKVLEIDDKLSGVYIVLSFIHYKQNGLKMSEAMISKALSIRSNPGYSIPSFSDCMSSLGYTSQNVANCIQMVVSQKKL